MQSINTMITVAEAAELIGTYPRQVQRLIRRGVLPGMKISKKLTAPYLIPLKAVEAYSAKKRAQDSGKS
jgi:excisionase family DNA binding protein